MSRGLGDVYKRQKFGFWEKFDDSHTVVRIATSWATKMEEIEQLIALM